MEYLILNNKNKFFFGGFQKSKVYQGKMTRTTIGHVNHLHVLIPFGPAMFSRYLDINKQKTLNISAFLLKENHEQFIHAQFRVIMFYFCKISIS